ncbi:hypothetical protein VTN96DRAFT_6593 [Rasamsonia emersonii]
MCSVLCSLSPRPSQEFVPVHPPHTTVRALSIESCERGDCPLRSPRADLVLPDPWARWMLRATRPWRQGPARFGTERSPLACWAQRALTDQLGTLPGRSFWFAASPDLDLLSQSRPFPFSLFPLLSLPLLFVPAGLCCVLPRPVLAVSLLFLLVAQF